MPVGRRKLLVIGGSAVLSLSCGGPGMLTAPDPVIAAGNVQELPAGTLRAIRGKGAAIGRDAGGIYALSLICTHQGCDISSSGTVSAGSIACSCHGSVFDGQGNPVRGPAPSPLPHLVVTKDAQGNLTIHGDQTTLPSTRLPV